MEVQSRSWLEVLVSDLPKDYQDAWTISSEVLRSGIGLHTGEEANVRLFPSEKPGFYVSWVGRKDKPIRLSFEQVRDTQLCTTLEIDGNRLATVEHLLAALSGCGVTNVHIEVSGNEIPLLDGSAIGWVEAICEAGLVPANTSRPNIPVLKEPLILYRGESVITATPSDKFRLIGLIDFPYKAIGRQAFEIELTPERFITEIAPARTFGFRDQLEDLIAAGLIKGGSLKNALICDGDHWLNPPLRFEDEPVRHKLLDLIGDLSLVGFPKAQILAYKGSHGLHSDFAAALINFCPEPFFEID